MSDPVRIIGLKGLTAKLQRPEWVHGPARNFLARWVSAVQRATVANIKRGPGGWVDTGETRKSITHQVDRSPFPRWAKAGSNLAKARTGEYGTGLLSEDPTASKQRHWPDPSELDAWAARKKITDKDDNVLTGADIARIIGIRGGIKPRRFLRDAVAETEKDLPRFLATFTREIETEAGRGVE